MVHSIAKLYLFFTVPMHFYCETLFITQLKLSLDSLLLPNQNNGVLEYSLFIWTLPGFAVKSLIFHYFSNS